MTPTRWREIERVYNAALERSPADRAAFLTDVCKGDPELRREVESLLAQDASKTGTLDLPAWGLVSPSDGSVMSIAPGTQLGPYKIEGPLGEGGMGEVFRGVDTRLGRSVAVKTSREQFSARFDREARAISALNHPNICTLYDVGPNYLVMELLEGETLSTRIRRGKLTTEEVLRYGQQIAEALAEAHSKGIVHRDLKPANVMLTRNGLKVLDFGLAKMSDPAGETLTQSHVVMGTPAYMAPEQARGAPAGPAADLFALGLVLYEMAEGKLPVAGGSLGSAQANGASVPIPRLSRADIPAGLFPLIARLLEAQPERRPSSAAEVRDRLSALGQVQVKGGRRPALVAAGLALVVLIAAGIWWVGTRRGRPVEVTRLSKLTSFPGTESDPALSPDGRSVAFTWNGEDGKNFDIYVMPVDKGAPIRLTQDPKVDYSPAWSPDGRQIAFARIGAGEAMTLLVVPARGGPERVVREFKLDLNVRFQMRPLLTWTPDGSGIVYASQDQDFARSSLYVTDPEGKTSRRLFVSEEASRGNTEPAISRDGKWLAFATVDGPGNARLFAGRLEPGLQWSGPASAVSEQGPPFVSNPIWASNGKRLLFLQGRSIFEWEAGKKPRQIFTGSNRILGISAAWESGRPSRIVTADSSDHLELKTIPLQTGGLASSGDPVGFAESTSNQTHPWFSPDGQRITFLSERSGAVEVWIADASGRNLRQLTRLNAARMGCPRWSPDGKRIAFHTWVGNHPQVFVIDGLEASGDRAPAVRQITDASFGFFSPEWSMDGKYLYADKASGTARCFRIPVDGGAPEDLFEGVTPVVTADGRRILFAKIGHRGVFLRALEGDPATNSEERLVEDYCPPGMDLNPVRDGFYYFGCDQAGRRNAVRFYSFERKTSVDVTVASGAGYSQGLAIAPDRSRLVYEQFTGSGSDLTLIELR